ncbi:pilus assembly protein [Rhodopseudomonas sp. HC1]|uniref:TadE/TadG family type IV pilus assembly protein n=1 Tax=Rhodopseudomonas infernalis TaxID=2897386 RepID=UPI001EE99C95|nr:pilus assembly protein [Rhodopseudomonas infernalis]MCG6204025.1 pilus assembly protein [Rhodopseudomonas infernalis]
MSLRSPGRLESIARRFGRASGGNVAVLFAISLLPILGFVGAAIDYSRASKARTAMQAALDSAALMVSRDLSSGAITAAQVTAKAQTYFTSLYTNTEATGVTVTASYTAKDSTGSSTILLTGGGTVGTDFMNLFGFPTLGIGSTSTATWGGTRLRVAMALDVTGSMAYDDKLPTMKTAAKNLIESLRASAQSADDVYISIIPFAHMVNVGVSNKGADWLKWDDWNENEGSCTTYRNDYRSYDNRTDCQNAGRTWTPMSTNNWRGCVTDRDQPADTTKDAPTSNATRFPARYALLNSTVCPAQIVPMTSVYSADNATTLKGKIDALTANGGTNQPIGMAWAWLSLQTGNPLNTPAKDSNFKYTDAIILLSDGLNTMDRWPSYGNGQVQYNGQIDARQKLLCDNIRASATNTSRTVIYTIQVNTGGDPESAILRYCADSGNFFATTTASGISSAFAQIGSSLSKLRIAK